MNQDEQQRVKAVKEFTPGVSAPGSRNGWWMDDCEKHGRASFNTIVNGCEQCARERLEKK